MGKHMGINKNSQKIIFINGGIKMNILRLKEMQKNVIKGVESMCAGSSESVLPAIFFADVDELDIIQQVKLQAYIDMYGIGLGVGLAIKK